MAPGLEGFEARPVPTASDKGTVAAAGLPKGAQKESWPAPKLAIEDSCSLRDAPGTVLSTDDVRETREVPAWGGGIQGTEILNDWEVKVE